MATNFYNFYNTTYGAATAVQSSWSSYTYTTDKTGETTWGAATMEATSYRYMKVVYTSDGTECASVKHLVPIRGGLYEVERYIPSLPPETPEERAAREAREKEERAKREAAEKRAEELFVRVAGEETAFRLKEKGQIDVVGKSGRRYRLRLGQKVDVMAKLFGDKVAYRLCAVHSDWTIPKMDTLIAQYLFLTSGREEEFEKIAIRHAA